VQGLYAYKRSRSDYLLPVFYIPSNAKQWIENIGEDDLKFIYIVSPPWNVAN